MAVPRGKTPHNLQMANQAHWTSSHARTNLVVTSPDPKDGRSLAGGERCGGGKNELDETAQIKLLSLP